MAVVKRAGKISPKRNNIMTTILIISISMLIISGAAVVLILHSTEPTIFYSGSSRRDTSEISVPYVESEEEILTRELSEISIELIFDNNTEKLTGKSILSLVDIRKDGDTCDYSVNQQKVMEYAESLAKKYDTFVPQYTFTSSDGEEVSLNNIGIGWLFDKDHASMMITNYLKEKRSVKLVLTDKSDESNQWWLRIASDYEAVRKRGKCYAEVSIDSQYMWLYKDGKVVFQSPVVTGNPNVGNDTPKGAFVIQEKVSPATLYGEGWEREISYWMGFNYDVGFHDAEWQESFGGDQYLENGSHGCVNLPVYAAEELYKYCYVYMPVYVY